MESCKNVATSDRAWLTAARDAGIVAGCELPGGPSAEETKRKQRGSALGGIGHAGAETGAKLLASVTHGGAAVGAGALSVLVTVGSHVEGLYKSLAEAAELRHAYARDAVNLAVVWTAAGALPRDYVAQQGWELRAVAGERGGASKILTPLMRDDSRWQALKSQSEASARMGRNLAARLGLRSPGDVARQIAKDSSFARAFAGSLAFRHGVTSQVFLEQRHATAAGG